MRNNDVTDTFSMLAGKTIKRVIVYGVNAVGLEADNGKVYLVETVPVGVLGLSAMEITEVDPEQLVSMGFME